MSDALAIAIEGVEAGAVEAGLRQETARVLARQALLGAAAFVDDGTQSPSALKDRVASAGGTTIMGLAVLEDAGVRGAFMRAVQGTAAREAGSRGG